MKNKTLNHLITLTPFFPGIAHSQVIRFSEPSGFFIGLATKPWNIHKTENKSKLAVHGYSEKDDYLQRDGPSAKLFFLQLNVHLLCPTLSKKQNQNEN